MSNKSQAYAAGVISAFSDLGLGLIKQAVSYKWVNDRVTDAMRKGVTPERLGTFSDNILDTARRAHGPQRVESLFAAPDGGVRRKLLERVSSKATQADMHAWDMHAAYPGGVGMPSNPEMRPAIEDLINIDNARSAAREARNPVHKDPAIIAAEAKAARSAAQEARNPVHKDPAIIAAEEQAAREARKVNTPANIPANGSAGSSSGTPSSPYLIPALAAAGLAIPALAYAVRREDPQPYEHTA